MKRNGFPVRGTAILAAVVLSGGVANAQITDERLRELLSEVAATAQTPPVVASGGPTVPLALDDAVALTVEWYSAALDGSRRLRALSERQIDRYVRGVHPAQPVGTSFDPVFGVAASHVLLDERLTSRQWLGAVLIVATITTIAVSQPKTVALPSHDSATP